MKYCKFCGKPIDDDSSFCTYCGKNQGIKRTSLTVRKIGSMAKSFCDKMKSLKSKFRLPRRPSNSAFLRIKKWLKRIAFILITIVVIVLLVLFGLWLYGVYQTSKWKKYDQSRVDIAMKDISKADDIAKELFQEHVADAHLYHFDWSSCGYPHVEKGLEIIRNAAEKGDANAQFTLGCIYRGARYDLEEPEWREFTMLDSSVDYERAAYWFNQSAMQGNPAAMVNLAHAYRFGEGVGKDEVKASELMKAAAEKGNPWAQLNYGDMFRDGDVWVRHITDSVRGISVPVQLKPNIEKAKEWWRKALNNGNDKAKERLERLYNTDLAEEAAVPAEEAVEGGEEAYEAVED